MGMHNYSETQREIAEKARKLILANLERHVTIGEIARTLHVSQSQVKLCFSRVYGVPVYSYEKECRMKAAAERLKDSDDSILEIAEQYGYENGSKFASAFRKVTGFSPREYRKQIRGEQAG